MIKATLLNVIFADGEFVGVDDGGSRFCGRAAIGQGSDFVLAYIVDIVAEVLGTIFDNPKGSIASFPFFTPSKIG